MAKPPSKRRGITLGPRADSAVSRELLGITQEASASTSATSDQKPFDTETLETMQEQLAELRRMNTDLDTRWRLDVEKLEEQLRRMEQQRDEIMLQASELQTLQRESQASRRLGILVALLALTGVAALGFHTWPQLQYVAGDLNRVSTGVGQLAPQLQAVRGQVTSLTSDMRQMDGSMASLREDVSGVRSDLGSLRRTVDPLPESKGAVQASVGAERSAAHSLPRNATTMSNPYWAMRPMRRW